VISKWYHYQGLFKRLFKRFQPAYLPACQFAWWWNARARAL